MSNASQSAGAKFTRSGDNKAVAVAASANSNDGFVSVPLAQRILLFGQLRGRSLVRLTNASPLQDCQAACGSPREIVLRRGQVLVASDMWRIEFKPRGTTREECIVMVLLAG